jgi:hypothetical protein
MSYYNQPITITASATLNRNVHAGNTVCLNALAGLTVTLPASTGKGDQYEVFVLTTVTSNNYIIQVANSTDILAGAVHLTTDIAGTSMPTSTTSDTITMNGTTTGGLRGTWLRFKDASLASGRWKAASSAPAPRLRRSRLRSNINSSGGLRAVVFFWSSNAQRRLRAQQGNPNYGFRH